MEETWGLELRGLDEMQRELEKLAAKALPYAARETLNGLAFAGRAIWQGEMRASLHLRNAWTTRQALVAKVSAYRMADMQATLGHTEDYMRRLEQGKGERAKRSGVPIATETTAGQAKGSLRAGRKRAVKKSFIIRVLGKIKRQSRSLSRKARNARAVKHAISSGQRLAYLDLDRRRGIYRVTGGRKNPKVLKLYDLTRRAVPLPRIPTLQRTIDETLTRAPSIGLAAVMRQLDRYGIGSPSR